MRRYRADEGDRLLVTTAWLAPVIACVLVNVMLLGQMIAYHFVSEMRMFWRTEFPFVGDTWGALVATFSLLLLFSVFAQWHARWRSIAVWGAIALTAMQLVALQSVRSTILDDTWYESMILDERSEPWYVLALIVDETAVPTRCGAAATRCVQVEYLSGNREWVAVSPDVEPWHRVVVVTENVGIYSGKRQLVIESAVETDDWQLFWSLYRQTQRDAPTR